MAKLELDEVRQEVVRERDLACAEAEEMSRESSGKIAALEEQLRAAKVEAAQAQSAEAAELRQRLLVRFP